MTESGRTGPAASFSTTCVFIYHLLAYLCKLTHSVVYLRGVVDTGEDSEPRHPAPIELIHLRVFKYVERKCGVKIHCVHIIHTLHALLHMSTQSTKNIFIKNKVQFSLGIFFFLLNPSFGWRQEIDGILECIHHTAFQVVGSG